MSTTITPLEFLEKSKPFHLTIKDVLEMEEGKKYNIFFLTPDMVDLSCHEKYNTPNVATKPSQFFKKGYFIDFYKKAGLQGNWKWTFEKEIIIQYIQEFDLNVDTEWTTMIDGKVNIGKEKVPVHYTDFPLPTTFIGWKGPMMLSSNMDLLPDIVWKQD